MAITVVFLFDWPGTAPEPTGLLMDVVEAAWYDPLPQRSDGLTCRPEAIV